MRPQTVDPNRPKGRFRFMGSELAHAWASGELIREKSEDRLPWLTFERLPSVAPGSCVPTELVEIGPLWTDLLPASAILNRTTVDRLSVSSRNGIGIDRRLARYQCNFPHSSHVHSVLAHRGQVRVCAHPKEAKFLT